MTVIEASASGFKDMADGTVRFYFDVEPRNAEAALRLFRSRGTPAALARLTTQAEQQAEPEKPKGGELAKWAAIRCQDRDFHQWLADAFSSLWWGTWDQNESAADCAATVIRAICGIQSRAELDTNREAAAIFNEQIRLPWQSHCKERGVIAQ